MRLLRARDCGPLGLRRPESLRAVLAVGFTGLGGLAGQVLVVRELLSAFQGNELTLGLFLAVWLAAEAGGAAAGGRLGPAAERRRSVSAAYAPLLGAYALLLPVAVFFSRGLSAAAWGGLPGEAPGLGAMLGSSALLLGVPAALHGAQFPLACSLLAAHPLERWRAAPVARAYVLESAGTFVAGPAVTLALVLGLDSLQAALVIAALHGGAVWALAAPPGLEGWRRPVVAVGVAAAAAVLLAAATPLGAELHRASLGRRWRGFELALHRDTPYGPLSVVRAGEQQTLYSGGRPTLTVPAADRAVIDDYVHLAAAAHPKPERVLLVAGGPGGMIEAALGHPVEALTYVELDPEVPQVVRALASPGTEAELGDPRVQVRTVDGRRYLRERGEPYDLILLGFLEPDSLQTHRLFSAEFFELAERRLRPGGILAVPLPGTPHPGAETAAYNAALLRTAERAFVGATVIPGDGNILLASGRPLELDPEVLWRRLEERGLGGGMFSPAYLAYRLEAEQRGRFLDLLRRSPGAASSDLHPTALFHALRYWAVAFAPGLLGVFAAAGRLSLGVCLLAALAPAALAAATTAAACLRDRAQGRTRGRGGAAPALAHMVFTTGVAGMALDLLLLFLFQCLFGTVYQMLGLVMGLFMGGVLLGGAAGRRWHAAGRARAGLLALECGLMGLMGVLAACAAALRAAGPQVSPWPGTAALLLIAPAAGFLCAAEFPLAAGVLLDRRRGAAARTGGLLYACDLAGGLTGSLLLPLLLFPRFGLFGALAVLAVLKAASLTVLGHCLFLRRLAC